MAAVVWVLLLVCLNCTFCARRNEFGTVWRCGWLVGWLVTQALVRIAAQIFDTVGCEEDLLEPGNESKLPIAVAFAAVVERFVRACGHVFSYLAARA